MLVPSVGAQELSHQVTNLRAVTTFCVVSKDINVDVGKDAWLYKDAASDIFKTIVSKSKALNLPLKTEINSCDDPTYYISAYVQWTTPIKNGSRGINVELYIDGWDMPNGISNALIWDTNDLYVTDVNGLDFGDSLKASIANSMDLLGQDWDKSHQTAK